MFRRTPAAFALLLALGAASLSGCTDDDKASDGTSSDAPTSQSATDTGTTDTTEDTTDDPTDASDDTSAAPAPGLEHAVIQPGAIGAARVGMTRAEWRKTGLFADGASVCEGELIHWAGGPEGFSVLTDRDATITQLSVATQGPRTKHGDIGVGSTYGELKAAWPGLTKPVEDGFDQASVYPPGEEDGLAYIGFLLDAPLGELTDDTEIAAIAVTGGQKPNFQYDC